MSGNKKSLVVVLVIVFAMFISGCTTFVAGSKKEDGYDKKITVTRVAWLNPAMLRTKITRSAQGYAPRVSEDDKKNSKKAVSELVKLFAQESVAVVSSELEKNEVTIVSGETKPDTRLLLTASSARTECAPLGCVSSLWITAGLYDYEERKVVWRGSFKVGASYFSRNDTSVLQNFASALMDQLKNASLI